MSFADPRALWLLAAPAVAAVLVLLRHRRRLSQQRRLASPGVWDRVMGGVPATGMVRLGSWCVAAALLALALARPQWGELPVTESVRARDLAVAVDVSDSMLAPDVQPSRLAAALELLKRALPELEGNRMGVVVFAGDAYPLVPLTRDLSAVAAFLDGVQPGMVALPGSNLERAVAAAIDLLPSEGEGRVVVLMTDGENLQGQPAAAAERLRQAGVGVVGVTVGTQGGGPIPLAGPDGGVHYKRDRDGQPVVTRAHPETLAALARAANGEVLELAGQRSVGQLVAAVERLRTRQQEAVRTVHRVERFPLFLSAAAVALVLGFLASPWRRLAPAAVLLMALGLASPASAQTAAVASPTPSDPTPTAARQAVPWWQRLLPGGSRRLARSGLGEWRRGKLDEAARDFTGAATLAPSSVDRLYDLGTTLAAQGKLEEAAPLLRRAQTAGAPSAAYNGGTAALEQGKGEEAVAWLRQALLTDGDAADAKRNYELALRLLEKQQQQKQQEQKDQQDQKEKQQERQQPTPEPGQQEARPTPTPSMDASLLAALERAEAAAREKMRSPTPHPQTVEKDW